MLPVWCMEDGKGNFLTALSVEKKQFFMTMELSMEAISLLTIVPTVELKWMEETKMYKPLADSTLQHMKKTEIIELLRIAEHNAKVAQEYVDQQAKNLKDWKPVMRGRWENGNPICPVCGEDKFKDLDADIWCDWLPPFCPNCGAKMDLRNYEEMQ